MLHKECENIKHSYFLTKSVKQRVSHLLTRTVRNRAQEPGWMIIPHPERDQNRQNSTKKELKPAERPLNQGVREEACLVLKKAAQDLERVFLSVSASSPITLGYSPREASLLAINLKNNPLRTLLEERPLLLNPPAKSAHPSTRRCTCGSCTDHDM